MVNTLLKQGENEKKLNLAFTLKISKLHSYEENCSICKRWTLRAVVVPFAVCPGAKINNSAANIVRTHNRQHHARAAPGWLSADWCLLVAGQSAHLLSLEAGRRRSETSAAGERRVVERQVDDCLHRRRRRLHLRSPERLAAADYENRGC